MTLTVPVTGPSPYEVHIGHDLTDAVADRLKHLGARTVGIVHQPGLAAPARQLASEAQARGLRVELLPIPDAEAAKQLTVVGKLWDALADAAFTRSDVIVGLGGGAATDVAGFVAATWMRGIKVVQVPTTLLAMVDAAVGGKTGINTAAGKNLVGSFHEPDSVFVDLDRLRTLPMEEIVAGSAEIIKTGFIHDPVIIDRYLADSEACLDLTGTLPELVERAVMVKAAVAGEDLREAGLRETLNYGHTFGHAVEARENYTWRHGHAVAVGMMFEAYLALGRGLIDADLVDTHRTILESVGLPTCYPAGHFDELYGAMTRDKKNRDGDIRFVALTGVGKTTRIDGPSTSELRAAYADISHAAAHEPE